MIEDSVEPLNHGSASLVHLEVARHCSLKKGPQPPLRTNNPDRIIGLFADSPEAVDGILEEVETRAVRYVSGM